MALASIRASKRFGYFETSSKSLGVLKRFLKSILRSKLNAGKFFVLSVDVVYGRSMETSKL